MKNIKNLITISNDKYRSLILSVAGLIALIAVLLIFTLYTTSILERNTNLINATNRLANNSQSLIKDLFDVEASSGEDISSPHMTTIINRLKQLDQETEKLIPAFETGEKVAFAGAKEVYVPRLPNNIKSDFEAIKLQWEALDPLLDKYLEHADNVVFDSSDILYQLITQAKVSSIVMNDSLNSLTAKVYQKAKTNALIIRVIQIIGILAILAYFVIFLTVFIRRLQDTDAKLEMARRETTDILETVNTGLFLLDKDLIIGSQYSNALEKIMGTTRLAGENLTTVLRNHISDKDLDVTRQFVSQLYNPRVKENLVNDLNPLNKILFRDEQSAKNRYLDFKFSRVYENKNIARILVNVNDVSESVLLAQRLEKERAQNDLQIEMLATILNISPAVTQEFIHNTMNRINKINSILKNPGSSKTELENKLHAIYREMHSLKGESSSLKLHNFTKIASDAEDKMQALYNKNNLSGNDFLPLTIHLDELLTLTNLISQLGERITQAAHQMQSVNLAADETKTQTNQDAQIESYYNEFAQDIANRQNKKVVVDIIGDEFANIPSHLAGIIKEMSIQILRNAIAHGIELPQERLTNGKNETGTVSMRIYRNDHELTLMIKDDGRGIDYHAVRQKLIAQKLYTAEQAEALSEKQLINVLFTSGFSTKANVDEDAGRGVGLDVIKARIQEAHGKLNITSKTDQGTHFTITLPLS